MAMFIIVNSELLAPEAPLGRSACAEKTLWIRLGCLHAERKAPLAGEG